MLHLLGAVQAAVAEATARQIRHDASNDVLFVKIDALPESETSKILYLRNSETAYPWSLTARWTTATPVRVADAANRAPKAVRAPHGTPSQKEYACVAGSSVRICGVGMRLSGGREKTPGLPPTSKWIPCCIMVSVKRAAIGTEA